VHWLQDCTDTSGLESGQRGPGLEIKYSTVRLRLKLKPEPGGNFVIGSILVEKWYLLCSSPQAYHRAFFNDHKYHCNDVCD
jgi:hypothetical protein